MARCSANPGCHVTCAQRGRLVYYISVPILLRLTRLLVCSSTIIASPFYPLTQYFCFSFRELSRDGRSVSPDLNSKEGDRRS